jgi:hypothetical protein
MDIFTVMIVSTIVFVISFGLLILNFALGAKNMMKPFWFAERQKSFINTFVRHAIIAGISSLSGATAVVCFILFLVDKFSKTI